MKIITIRQALQQVADYPAMLGDDQLQKPVYELVARALYDIANHPDAAVRGSMTKANRARSVILNRLVGTRRSGSHPATREVTQLDFVDLTGEVISGSEPAADDEEDRDPEAEAEAGAQPDGDL